MQSKTPAILSSGVRCFDCYRFCSAGTVWRRPSSSKSPRQRWWSQESSSSKSMLQRHRRAAPSTALKPLSRRRQGATYALSYFCKDMLLHEDTVNSADRRRLKHASSTPFSKAVPLSHSGFRGFGRSFQSTRRMSPPRSTGGGAGRSTGARASSTGRRPPTAVHHPKVSSPFFHRPSQPLDQISQAERAVSRILTRCICMSPAHAMLSVKASLECHTNCTAREAVQVQSSRLRSCQQHAWQLRHSFNPVRYACHSPV